MSGEQSDIRQLIGDIVLADSAGAAEKATEQFARQVGAYYKTMLDITAPMLGPSELVQLVLNFQNNLFLVVLNAPKNQ